MDINTNKQGGFIKTILLIIIFLAILSYFGFNLREFIDRPIVKENFGLVWNIIANLWNTYLAGPVNYLWNNIFINLIWEPFVNALQGIKTEIPL